MEKDFIIGEHFLRALRNSLPKKQEYIHLTKMEKEIYQGIKRNLSVDVFTRDKDTGYGLIDCNGKHFLDVRIKNTDIGKEEYWRCWHKPEWRIYSGGKKMDSSGNNWVNIDLYNRDYKTKEPLVNDEGTPCLNLRIKINETVVYDDRPPLENLTPKTSPTPSPTPSPEPETIPSTDPSPDYSDPFTVAQDDEIPF